MRTQPSRSRLRPLATPVVVVTVCLLAGSCAAAGPTLPPTPAPSPDHRLATQTGPVRTRTRVGPASAGVELETVSVGSRRHTVLRTVAGLVIEFRIDGADWYVRGGLDDAGLPTDRWIHIDLDQLAAAGVEVPAWMTEPVHDAGFVFDLAPGDVHAGEIVASVDRSGDGRSATVVFASGLRAHGTREPVPADTVVDLPPAAEVVDLDDLTWPQ